jgi:hypothetical protein
VPVCGERSFSIASLNMCDEDGDYIVMGMVIVMVMKIR